jgi:L-2-hydroxyglutarate oxidase
VNSPRPEGPSEGTPAGAFDVIVVGGGIVGAATMYQIQRRHPELKLLLLEKSEGLAAHQTGHNSGVIHSGLYYPPGSSKALNCVRGRHALVDFAKEFGVPHDICGKVVAAATAEELPRLDKIEKLGLQNEIEGLERINADQLREIEPHVRAVEGLWVPCTGIIDFPAATRKMVEIALGIQPESKVMTGVEALGFSQQGASGSPGITVRTSRGDFNGRAMVACAGLQADRVARQDGVDLAERVVGFRGDYYELEDHAKHKVRNLIYPVPDPAFPFLGVHFTRMTDGNIECGPNAVFTFKREGYGKLDFSMRDTVDALGYIGTWRMFFENMSFGVNEYRRAFSKKLFLKTLQHLVPSLEMEDLRPGRSGVRALLLNKQGDTKDDFRIECNGRSIHVLNAPSPAATASLAIGEQVAVWVEREWPDLF